MQESFVINSEKLPPTAEELLYILEKHNQIEIRYVFLPTDYISKLTYSLHQYAVYNREWDKIIFIYPSIDIKKIITKQKEIYDCAKAFRQDGNYLMGLMASNFGIDLNTLDGLHDLKFNISDKQRGKLNDDWNYYLHGAECQFENVKNGQIVEVIIITKPEFGYLDCYFFYNYIASTERFKSLAAYFNHDYINICRAIEVLVFEGVLTKVNDLHIKRNVIAL